MNLTLITGLDGAGKTTFLKELGEKAKLNEKQIINVPHINLNVLKEYPELYDIAEFVTKLSKVGDVLQMPQLKAVGLFASMLLFKELFNVSVEGDFDEIYCERHPLIDTGVYALFYAGKLHPDSVDKNFLKKLDEKNAKELSYLLNLLPQSYIDHSKGLIENMMSFIFKWFYQEKKYEIKDLKALYNLGLPDKIYYLYANPEFLYDRIKERKMLEPHETIKALTMMGREYGNLFDRLSISNNGFVEFVNVEKDDELELLLKKLLV